jgi:hypothetical protein
MIHPNSVERYFIVKFIGHIDTNLCLYSRSFFLGNPGDYAWGREGLDAIVTQLLNQMDGTGPPPLAEDKIQSLPSVQISQEQVGKAGY